MAWTPDGMTILACSGDGTIALLMFSEKELGKPPLTGALQIWRHVLRNHLSWSFPVTVASMHTWSVATSPGFNPFAGDQSWTACVGLLDQAWYVWHLVCGIMHKTWAAHVSHALRTARELGPVPVLQEEVDKHIHRACMAQSHPQQMLFAESAGQLRLEAAAEERQGAGSMAAAPPVPMPLPGPRPGQPASGLAARLAPANGTAQPRDGAAVPRRVQDLHKFLVRSQDKA